MTTRAKFRCTSVEMSSTAPVESTRHSVDGKPTTAQSWPRTYRFAAVYDTSVPEDQRYAMYTPYGELKMIVDNPAVEFTPGRQYYLDFTPVPDPA